MVDGIRVAHRVKILGMFFQNRMREEEQYLLNYKDQLAKIRNTCQAWSSRSLSLKGKVTIVNSLMSSLLQYAISCTPVPVRAVVEYKKLIVDFLWNAKRSKIAYNHVIQDIESGGLRLAHLETRIQVGHIKWMAKLHDHPNSTQALILQEALGEENLPTILASRTNWVDRINPDYRMFKQILSTWRRWRNFEPREEGRVQGEILWNNKSVLIARKPFVWPTWRDAGIRYINDLLQKEEARFLSHEEIEQKFGVRCSFLQLLQIRAAIPVSWKRLLVSQASQSPPTPLIIQTGEGTCIEVDKVTTRKLYGALVASKKQEVLPKRKWTALFPDLAPDLGSV